MYLFTNSNKAIVPSGGWGVQVPRTHGWPQQEEGWRSPAAVPGGGDGRGWGQADMVVTLQHRGAVDAVGVHTVFLYSPLYSHLTSQATVLQVLLIY